MTRDELKKSVDEIGLTFSASQREIFLKYMDGDLSVERYAEIMRDLLREASGRIGQSLVRFRS